MGIDKDKSRLTAAAELRRQAEEQLSLKTAELLPPRKEKETRRLVHELGVHQIELEMQNEELGQARDEAEAALEKYADLYDFAPVGYVILDLEGNIRNVNFTGASLLGVERSRLLGRRFGLFVVDEARPFFFEFLGKVFTNPTKEACELSLLKEGNAPLFVRIEGVAAASGQECRIAMFDITERKRAEETLHKANSRLDACVDERTVELKDLNDTLEQRISERSGQLNSAMEALRASKTAALNLMEDAVIARKQAEETSDKLRLEIAERERVDQALRQSEERVRLKLESILAPEGDIGNLELEDIIDIPAIQALMDDFYKLAHIPMGLLDTKGKVLVGVGWQAACTRFHREHPETLKNCIESDTRLSAGIPEGEYRLYKCLNNLWDAATPVVVGGKHLGNLFTGQFFVEEELPDLEAFRRQADRLGFPSEEYMAAIQGTPRLNRVYIDTAMSYFMKFAAMISRLSYSNIKLARIVTERDTFIQSLRESELFYSQTLESIPGMVFTTRPDGYCDFQSSQWVEFTGVPMCDHMGDGWNRLLHPDDRPRAFEAWMAAVEGRARYNLEYRVRRHDGEYEWFKVIGRPIIDAAGQIVKWFGVAANIDAIKRGETELLQAKNAAEAANRAKSQFLANMSHELRTPMGGVLGMLELTLAGSLEPQQREFVETALKSGRSLLRILNDILDQTRIEAGKFTLELQPFSLAECVFDAVELLSFEAERKGLVITHSLGAGVPRIVIGDQLRLRQVLVNLIGNAVKFTEQGTIAVQVDAADPTPVGQRIVTFSISDTGIGIPADMNGILFDPFIQVDASHTRKYGGTGLGLTISREIADLMGGSIEVASTEGVGSTFTVSIAFVEGELHPIEESAAPLKAPALPEPAEAPDALYSPRLLLAEDDPVNRTIFSHALKLYNITSDIATNGLEAVEMWERGSYDLIIMDVQMPRMDGFETTRTIRDKERERGGYTPILAMTGYASRDDEQCCIDAGMDAFISKPVDLEKTIRIIRELTISKRMPA